MEQWAKQGALLVGGFLVACGPTTKDEPTSTDLAAMAEANVEQGLRGAHQSGSFVADSTALADALSPLAGSTTDCSTNCTANGVCTETTCTTESSSVTVADLQSDRDNLNQSIDDLVKTLKEKIFTADNLESSSNGTATYLLGPKTLCGSTTSESSTVPSNSSGGSSGSAQPSTSPPALDPDCVDEANRLQPRLRLSSPSSGNVDVELLLTGSKLNPATLELYRDHMAVVLDLGALKQTLDTAREDTGSLASMTGKIGLELKQNAALDYSLAFNVLEDVSLGVRAETGELASYGVAKSEPMLELRLDGSAKQVTGSVDFGALTAAGPLNAFRDSIDPERYDVLGDPIPRPTYTGAVAALVAGLEASVTLDGRADRLTFAHLGFGDRTSSIKVDDDVIAAFDLNPDAQRHFDLTLAKDPAGTVFTFAPSLDATVLLNFAPLASQFDSLAPETLNNTLHLWFEGQNPSLQQHGDEQVKVVAGTLHYTSSYDPTQNVTAAAGSCLASDAAGSTDTPAFVVSACQ